MCGIIMSEHCKIERLERMVYIATTVGFGDPVFEVYCEDKRECVTDTGVILVKSLNEDFLITAYIGSIDKISAMYHGAGYDKMPTWLYNKVLKNRRYLKEQDNL